VRPTLFLRIAAVLTLLQCTMHTVFGVFGEPKHGVEEIAVIETMKAHRFHVMGSMRAYWDFFFGYGLSVTIALFIQGILFWQLSTIIKTNPAASRPIVALFFFNCLANAVVCWKYFFVGPTITQLLIAACLALSFATATSA
jgi:phosphoglycerol transferase MdoB-like AlkP superfamily enzyme